MNFEIIKRSHVKRNIAITFVVIAIIGTVVLNFTKAKYRTTESIPLVNGTINYTPADLNAVAIYVNGDSGYTKTDTIPDGYVLNESESYCTVNGEEDTSINITYDTTSKTLAISPMTTKGTKCYLYFDEYVPPITVQDLIASKTIDNSRSGAITGIFDETHEDTLYTKQDDWGTSYVYAGNINNNWVYFAGYYWRIIRINGDGSIRMIYNGNSTNTTGMGTQLQTSAYNSESNDNAYVGYMYGSRGASSYSVTHTNTTNSTIKGILDNWYKTNIVDKKDSSGTSYNKYVSTEAGFCNDRKVAGSNETWWTSDTKRGYGTNATAYAPFSRFLTTSNSWDSTQTPSLNCSQSNDLFTTSGSSKGNKKLTYPVGLITVDEVVLAGGFGGKSNSSYYLYTGQQYWTMSPYYFGYGYAYVFYVTSAGDLRWGSVYYSDGVRPVINLNADVSFTGEGTTSSPYVVQ